jgi:hypothetical protein
MIQVHDLEEIPLKGRNFTWSNMQNNPLLEKLDWVFTSAEWTTEFPNTLSYPLSSWDLIILLFMSVLEIISQNHVSSGLRIIGWNLMVLWKSPVTDGLMPHCLWTVPKIS